MGTGFRGGASRLALAVLIVIVPVAVLTVGFMRFHATGYTGMQVDFRNRVAVIHPDSPAAQANLRVGDLLLGVNGSTDRHLLDSLEPGERVVLEWERNGQRITAPLQATALPWRRLGTLGWPLLSALAFWAAGVHVFLRTRRPSDDAKRFIIFAYLAALNILLNQVYTLQEMPYLVLLSIITAFSYVHFHRFFPFPIPPGKFLRALVWHRRAGMFLLAFGILIGLISLGRPVAILTAIFILSAFVYDVLARILVGGTLLYGYLRSDIRRVHSRIRLIAGATGLVLLFTLTALVMLFVLPSWQSVPARLSMMSQVLIPVAYLIALRREDFSAVDRVLNRALVYTLAVLILLGLHWAIVFALMWAVGQHMGTSLLLHSVLGASLAVLFVPLRDRVGKGINRLFYGYEGDLLRAGQRMARELAHSHTEDALRHLLTIRLPRLLDASGAVLLVWQQTKGWTCHAEPDQILAPRTIEAIQALAHQLVESPVQRAAQVHRLAPSVAVDPSALPPKGLFLGFASDFVRGVLWLAPKASDDIYTEQELRLLHLLVAPSTLALENWVLNQALVARTTELQYLHHALVMADERIRRDLARELHDHIMQDIYGELYALRARHGSEGLVPQDFRRVLHTLEKVVTDLRRLCHGLRPPVLEELGLVPALRALGREYSANLAPHMRLDVQVSELSTRLPSEVESSLFAIAKSALANAIRHSQATQISLSLEQNGAILVLEVWDNGVGFTVPANWAPLLRERRFGLAGMSERARMIGATFHVASSPGHGTRVAVRWRVVADSHLLASSLEGMEKEIYFDSPSL